MVRWFLDAEDNPDSHQNLIITFWCIYNIPWILHANLIRGICIKVGKLTSKNYVKTINLRCAVNKIFVKYQSSRAVLTPKPLPCVRPYAQPSLWALCCRLKVRLSLQVGEGDAAANDSTLVLKMKFLKFGILCQMILSQWKHLVVIIILIIYCGLVVHIIDTRAQKVVSYTSAHITETVFAHDQHCEEQGCLSLPQLYRHSQKHRKWINHTVGHWTTGVSTYPALRGARHFPSTSCFLCLVSTQCPHIFATQMQYWWDAILETIHRQLLHLVSKQECWIIEEKWRFVKSIRHLKRLNEKVGWRCASYKKSIQVVS